MQIGPASSEDSSADGAASLQFAAAPKTTGASDFSTRRDNVASSPAGRYRINSKMRFQSDPLNHRFNEKRKQRQNKINQPIADNEYPSLARLACRPDTAYYEVSRTRIQNNVSLVMSCLFAAYMQIGPARSERSSEEPLRCSSRPP
jgi:hypothetical protein